jgi:cystathionine beta-lyase family protein involved in aluminum resistance
METVSVQVEELMSRAERAIKPVFERVESIARINQRKVLDAFWAERVAESDFHGSTGYGLGDEGRDKLERVYARVFGTEAALVRPQIISGTHALRLGLFGILRPGDHVLFATGSPYDTLEAVVGIRPTTGSLAEWGISYDIVPLRDGGEVDLDGLLTAVKPETKLVMFQRSRGYSERPALSVDELGQAFSKLRTAHQGLYIGVDNCYGEFVEEREPTELGADLVMGSLIKNPGAGIAPTGGYVVGKAELVEAAAVQLTAPGIGSESGPSHSFLRLLYQALFLAPHTVSQAVKGSILASYVLAELGLAVSPRWNEPRADLIVSARFNDPEKLLAFSRAVQMSAPVDSFVRPVAAPMAGYEDDVVMAAGAFVQGGSLELSADGPMRPPYIGYMQGGLTYEHVYIAMERIAMQLLLTN